MNYPFKIKIPLFPSLCLLGELSETDSASHYLKPALILAKKAMAHGNGKK